MEPLRQLPRHALSRHGGGLTTLADKYIGGNINAANVAGGDWSGLTFDVTNTSDFGG